jgi:protein-L-isoaspartate(D-aspartate) O-methyltransferase
VVHGASYYPVQSPLAEPLTESRPGNTTHHALRTSFTHAPAAETRSSRKRMVRQQLARRGIGDRRVLAAMAWVPREWFLPPSLAAEAYHDGPLPIGSGQTISQPFIVALMTASVAAPRPPRARKSGRDPGTRPRCWRGWWRGSSPWSDSRPAGQAEERFRRLGLCNIETRLGDGAARWRRRSVRRDRRHRRDAARPTPLLHQLATGGLLVAPVGDQTEQEPSCHRTASGWHEQGAEACDSCRSCRGWRSRRSRHRDRAGRSSLARRTRLDPGWRGQRTGAWARGRCHGDSGIHEDAESVA